MFIGYIELAYQAHMSQLTRFSLLLHAFSDSDCHMDEGVSLYFFFIPGE